ncbi:endoplasmic reticulum metallopeptidase 1 [Senna tora]|uniref:Endoplasmic reticulum metallopeptidase 1 n=1 Tax=Senna tora TaxID=362788 RepID=A0A834XF72_9FABA|nr:endoplasmic reticulum metallopeptidase 1 [Senna tora]
MQGLFAILFLCYAILPCLSAKITPQANPTYNIVDYGASGNGQDDDSQAFLKAWDVVCNANEDSPTLFIPKSKTFLLQPMVFQGVYVPDFVVAVLIGVMNGWCLGPLLPICGHCSFLTACLHLTGLFFSIHSILQIVEANYEFSVVDSNSLLFLFKHSPEVARELNVPSDFSFQSACIRELLFSIWLREVSLLSFIVFLFLFSVVLHSS